MLAFALIYALSGEAIAALGYFLTLPTLPWLGNHGLWLAVTVFLALRGVSLWIIWLREWRLNRWFNN
nr:MATE family efflux transporter [Candidatus Pantoea persica]